MFKRLCDIAHKLIVLDVSVFIKSADDEALVLLDLVDMLDNALVELLVLYVADVGNLDLLYFFVLQVATAQLIIVLG